MNLLRPSIGNQPEVRGLTATVKVAKSVAYAVLLRASGGVLSEKQAEGESHGLQVE
jgi:hypothetical protein